MQDKTRQEDKGQYKTRHKQTRTIQYNTGQDKTTRKSKLIQSVINFLLLVTWLLTDQQYVREKYGTHDIGLIANEIKDREIVCHDFINPHNAKMFSYHFFLFVVIINVHVSSFRFIWIPMLWVYGHYTCFNSFSVRNVFKRLNLTSTDVRFWCIKTVRALKGLKIHCIHIVFLKVSSHLLKLESHICPHFSVVMVNKFMAHNFTILHFVSHNAYMCMPYCWSVSSHVTINKKLMTDWINFDILLFYDHTSWPADRFYVVF